MLKICVLTLFSLLSAAASCAAASNEGASGGQFLRIGVDARSAALGETGAAVSGVQGLFYNPAGLAGVQGAELYASHISWVMETYYSNLAFAKRAGAGVYGLAVSYLSAPPTEKYDKLGTKLSDTYSASDLAVTLGYSYELAGNTDLGLNVKYISSSLDTESATALAADAGLKYTALPGQLELGFVLQNVGGSLKYVNEGDSLPMNLKLGGQYTFNVEKAAATKKDLSIFADLNSMKDSGLYANVGVDLLSVYDRSTKFSMRAGYRTNASGKSAGLSAGLGVDLTAYFIDYAYAPMGDLGDTHRLSFTYKFGAKNGGTK
jgi:hypothetical protein